MSAYADPFIAPDMSNYYRLLREKQRRLQIRRDYPEFEQTVRYGFEDPAVKSFLQSLPTRHIPLDDEPQDIVRPGVIPRGIEISNSIIERKIYLLRIAEAVVAGQDAADDLQTAKNELSTYCEHLGLEIGLSESAVEAITKVSENMVRAKRFTVVPGAAGPKL